MIEVIELVCSIAIWGSLGFVAGMTISKTVHERQPPDAVHSIIILVLVFLALNDAGVTI